MQAVRPHVDVPGDNAGYLNQGHTHPLIMARSGDLVGFDADLAVWRFGFTNGSEAARAYGVSLPNTVVGFVWVLATRKTGKVREHFIGYSTQLPAPWRNVIERDSTPNGRTQ